MARIFISYSTSDPDPAQRIRQWLESNGFETPFIDVTIAPGADWERELYHQLERSLAVILVVTPGWLASKWCFAEFTQARALGKPIFPIIETALDEPFVAPEIQRLDLIRDREGGLERLLGELDRIRLDAQGGFPFPPDRSPYPGLQSFDEADAAIYFGRDEEIRRLRELMRARQSQGGSRLILILGASGSGKSSLLRAGVLPRIKREPDQWILIGPFRPHERPVEQLTVSLALALDRTKSFDQIHSLLVSEDPQGVETLVRDLRLHFRQPNAFVLFAIDQGEELFSLSGTEDRRQFLEILTQIAIGSQPALALMTFRSDFLGRLQSDAALGADFHDFKINPLPAARVPEIIDGPAKVVGLEVEDRLVLRATQHVSRTDALPLLAFALSELYERHGRSGQLTLDQYQTLGDAARGLNPLENAVRKTADRIVDKNLISGAELTALRDAFIPALVRVDADGDYVRRTAPHRNLPSAAEPLLERLLEARLLTATQRDGERVIEVSHEALLRDWPLLRGWLDEEREFLLGKDQLRRDLTDWREAPPEHRAQALLTGLKLSRASAWLHERPDKLTAEERQFVQESLEAAERALRQRTRMRRALIFGSLAASVLLAAAAVFSSIQWQAAEVQRDQARAALLAGRSLDALGTGRIYDAAELAHQAMQIRASPSARSALLQSLVSFPPELDARGLIASDVPVLAALPRSPRRLLVATAMGHVVSVDRKTLMVSPTPGFAVEDTQRILTLDETARGDIALVRESGQAEFLSAKGRDSEKPGVIRLGEWIVAADISTDHGLIAFFAEDSQQATIARCDLVSDTDDIESCERYDLAAGLVSAIRIDPTGRLIAFGTEDGDIVLVEVGTNAKPRAIPVGGRVVTLAWDLLGHWLACGILREDGRYLLLIDPKKAQVIAETRTGTGVTSLAWNSDSTAIAGNCGDRGIGVCVWSRSLTGLVLSAELFGHRESVHSISWAEGRLTSLGLDNNILVWVLGRRSEVFGAVEVPSSQVRLTDLDAAKHSPRLAVGTSNGAVLIFDPEARKLEDALSTGFADAITSVRWDREAKQLTAADKSGRVFVWARDKYPQVHELKVDNGRIDAIGWGSESGRVYVPLRDGRIASVDVKSGEQSYSAVRHKGAAGGLTVADDGSFLVSGDTFGELIIWSADNLEIIARLPSSLEVVGDAVSRGSLSLSSDSTRLAVAGNDGRVLVYDTEEREIDCVLETKATLLQDVAYSNDDTLIAALTNDDKIHVWSSGQCESFATLNLKHAHVHVPGRWPANATDWRTEEISWLADSRTLAVSTTAGSVFLINLDSAAWSAEVGAVLGGSAH